MPVRSEELPIMTTVPSVMEAFDRLLTLAQQGQAYRMDQVFVYPAAETEVDHVSIELAGETDEEVPDSDHFDEVKVTYTFKQPDPAKIFGNGYDFEAKLAVPDIVRDKGRTVEAVARLRVIATVDGELFLRTWLIWTPTDGKERKSYACYQITREAAERLAQSASEDHEEPVFDPTGLEDTEVFQRSIELLFDAVGDAAAYKANWSQTYEGSDGAEGVSEAIAELNAIYQEQVITELAEAGTAVTCMLSFDGFGAVEADELATILEWVETQPRAAA